MSSSSAVGIYNDFTSGKAGVSVRSANDKLAGWVYVKLVIGCKEGFYVLRHILEHHWDNNVLNI